MSKPQALTWAIGCGIVAVCCFAIGLAYFDIAALIAAVGFGLIWLMKVLRDYGISHEVQADGSEPKELPLVMTSPGSNGRFFVPDKHPSDR